MPDFFKKLLGIEEKPLPVTPLDKKYEQAPATAIRPTNIVTQIPTAEDAAQRANQQFAQKKREALLQSPAYQAWQQDISPDLLAGKKGGSPRALQAKTSLRDIETLGGELSDRARRAWVQQYDQAMLKKNPQHQPISSRPDYAQKSEFYKWLRKMEAWANDEDYVPPSYDLGYKPPLGKDDPYAHPPVQRRLLHLRNQNPDAPYQAPTLDEELELI